MNKKENPDTLFLQLAAIESEFCGKNKMIEQDDLVVIVIKKSLHEYAQAITAEKRVKGAHLMLDDL